jgi:GNAT superfamily N-acetyltransferase
MIENHFSNSIQPEENQIEIILYQDELKDKIRLLNYEWLEKYFRVEEGDKIALTNPKEQVIDRGGFIFFVFKGDSIIGTAALLRKSNFVFELGKMVVAPTARGTDVGTRLLKHCIQFAFRQGIEKMIHYSNTCLAPSIHLYQKYGFRKIALEKGLYEQANIKMELNLV